MPSAVDFSILRSDLETSLDSKDTNAIHASAHNLALFLVRKKLVQEAICILSLCLKQLGEEDAPTDIILLLTLCHLERRHYKLALHWVEKSLMMENLSEDLIVDLQLIKADILFSMGNVSDAKTVLIHLAKSNNVLATLKLANLFLKQGDTSKSLETLNSVDDTIKKMSESFTKARILNNVGVMRSLFSAKTQSTKALENFDDSLAVLSEVQDSSPTSKDEKQQIKLNILINKAALYNILNAFELAYPVHQKANKVATSCGSVLQKLRASQNFGYALVRLKRWDEAEQVLNEALRYAVKSKTIRSILECHEALGSIHFIKQDLNKAKTHFSTALQIIDSKKLDISSDAKPRLLDKLSELVVESSTGKHVQFHLPLNSGPELIAEVTSSRRTSDTSSFDSSDENDDDDDEEDDDDPTIGLPSPHGSYIDPELATPRIFKK